MKKILFYITNIICASSFLCVRFLGLFFIDTIHLEDIITARINLITFIAAIWFIISFCLALKEINKASI
jgi:hypothetical protein